MGSFGKPKYPSAVAAVMMMMTHRARRWLKCAGIVFVLLGVAFLAMIHREPSSSSPPSVKTAVTTTASTTTSTTTITTTSSTTIATNSSTSTSTTRKPKIAWLMSFPNSGTTYTLTTVAQVSNRSFASNYGRDVLNEHGNDDVLFNFNEISGTNTCIYGNDVCLRTGPYYRHYNTTQQQQVHSEKEYPLPEHYVLTKTHCGGLCLTCDPMSLNFASYKRSCSQGMGIVRHPALSEKTAGGSGNYPQSWVFKAIHLIRNPFHNIIARYHYYRKKEKKTAYAQYPDNATGFYNWCQDIQTTYFDKRGSTKGIQTKDLHCWFEFYRYVIWHNFAIQTWQHLRDNSELSFEETLTIYYENYEPKTWNTTMSTILDFLQLETNSILIHETIQTHPFRARHDYDFFPLEQQKLAVEFLKKHATEDTWNAIKHYFEDLG